MTELKKIRLEKPVFKSFVNTYLVKIGKKCVLIDTGYPEHFEELKKEIGDLSLEYIIITHCHSDHVGSAAALKKHFNCKIIVSEYENKKMIQGINSDLVPRNKAMENLLKLIEQGPKEVSAKCEGDILITNKSYCLNDYGLEIFLTKGHTPGSISVISRKTKDFIVGDLLAPTMEGGFDHSGFCASLEDFKKSIGILLKVGEGVVEKVYTGHHNEPFTFEALKKKFK